MKYILVWKQLGLQRTQMYEIQLGLLTTRKFMKQLGVQTTHKLLKFMKSIMICKLEKAQL